VGALYAPETQRAKNSCIAADMAALRLLGCSAIFAEQAAEDTGWLTSTNERHDPPTAEPQSTAVHATDIQTRGGTNRVRYTVGSDTVPLTMTFSNALQQALAEIEVITALAACTALPGAAEHADSSPYEREGADDLLVIDGPPRNLAHLPRTMGLI